MHIQDLDACGFLDSMDRYIQENLPELKEGPGFRLRFPLLPRNDLRLPEEWVATTCRSLVRHVMKFFPEFSNFEPGASVLAQILAASRDLEGKKIWTLSRACSIPPSLFTLFCIYLLRPFRQQAATRYSSFLTTFPEERTYCPLCGASPALGISGEIFWCCHCGSRRHYPVHLCPSCTGRNLQLQRINDLDVMSCKDCRRYFKLIPKDQIGRLDLYYISTSAIDEEMHARGWVREYPILPATLLPRE